MKLKIDFTNKVITVEEQTNVAELFQKLQELFPNDSWKEYKLETPVQFRNDWWYPFDWYQPIPASPIYDTSPVMVFESMTTGKGVIQNPTFTTDKSYTVTAIAES